MVHNCPQENMCILPHSSAPQDLTLYMVSRCLQCSGRKTTGYFYILGYRFSSKYFGSRMLLSLQKCSGIHGTLVEFEIAKERKKKMYSVVNDSASVLQLALYWYNFHFIFPRCFSSVFMKSLLCLVWWRLRCSTSRSNCGQGFQFFNTSCGWFLTFMVWMAQLSQYSENFWTLFQMIWAVYSFKTTRYTVLVFPFHIWHIPPSHSCRMLSLLSSECYLYYFLLSM